MRAGSTERGADAVAEKMMRRDTCPKSVSDYAIPFALWDLRLFLDTHPDCAEALAMFEQLCAQNGDVCACRVPMTENGHFAWIDGPWPWEYDANAVSGKICGGSACSGGNAGCGCGCSDVHERRG